MVNVHKTPQNQFTELFYIHVDKHQKKKVLSNSYY